MIGVSDSAQGGGYGADKTLAVAFRQRKARGEQSLAVRLEPHAPVFVDDNVGDLWIADCGKQLRPQLPLQELVAAPFLDLLC
jgi:hypothetical protein